MHTIDLNEQFIVYAIYNGCGRWYISDKEIWYLDYRKRIEAYQNIGYDISEYIDERRKDLLYLNVDNISLFLEKLEEDECTFQELKDIYIWSERENEYKPSLYIDFDNKILYSMYREPASYEKYVPLNWYAKYKDFLCLVPREECYWLQ